MEILRRVVDFFARMAEDGRGSGRSIPEELCRCACASLDRPCAGRRLFGENMTAAIETFGRIVYVACAAGMLVVLIRSGD